MRATGRCTSASASTGASAGCVVRVPDAAKLLLGTDGAVRRHVRS
jgi:hypothetical protein